MKGDLVRRKETPIETIALDAEGIARASGAARELLHEQRINNVLNRREAVATWITFENDLLRLQDHFGADTEAEMIERRVLGRRRLLIRVRGEHFDPRDRDELDEWEYSAYRAAGLLPGYSYLGGYNTLTLTEARKPLSSLMRLLLALVLGIIVSAVGSALLPEETRSLLLKSVVQPTFDLLVGMLGGLAGPLVFFSMAWGICGIGNAASLGSRGIALLKRFFSVSVHGVVLALVACLLIYGWGASSSSSGGNLLIDLYTTLIGLVPTNLLKPFVDKNTAQIVLLAVAVGIATLAIGETVDGIGSFVRQGNELIQFLMEQLCRFVPLIIFVMTVSQVWSGTFATLVTAWFPVLVCVLLMGGFVLLEAFLTSRHTGISFARLLRICLPAMIVGLTTASSSAAMKDELAACTEELGLSEKEVSFGVPLAMVLCKPTAMIEIALLLTVAQNTYGSAGDLIWYVRLALSAFVFAIVVPPVPGGMLSCFSLMFAELGIPTEALALVAALDVILDYPSTGTNVATHILALAHASVDKREAKKPRPA